ncbi:hypothetical protein ACQ86N_23325 [Puia sp. P3]|uniref:hypothetical protein n=1 Tax=Puia sp. P3 TaxID=3423952 RepID=UPI003D6687D8
MKNLIAILAFLSVSCGTYSANAQVQVSVNVNIGSQPQWGPQGYQHVDYYYMPDIDVYYCVPRQQFVYFDGANWVFGVSLPSRCQGYDLYRGYKVVINEPNPGSATRSITRATIATDTATIASPPLRDCRHDDDDHDGPGRHGKGHAYGHYKKHHGENE